MTKLAKQITANSGAGKTGLDIPVPATDLSTEIATVVYRLEQLVQDALMRFDEEAIIHNFLSSAERAMTVDEIGAYLRANYMEQDCAPLLVGISSAGQRSSISKQWIESPILHYVEQTLSGEEYFAFSGKGLAEWTINDSSKIAHLKREIWRAEQLEHYAINKAQIRKASKKKNRKSKNVRIVISIKPRRARFWR